jgi:hypothetical protein
MTYSPSSSVIRRLGLGAVSGAVIAWVLTAFFTYSLFASGGYTEESFIQLSSGAFLLNGGIGALFAVILILLYGRRPLPNWLRGAAVGSLVATVFVVFTTHVVARVMVGPIGKLQGPYLQLGLVYAVPIAIAVGAVTGAMMSKRRST